MKVEIDRDALVDVRGNLIALARHYHEMGHPSNNGNLGTIEIVKPQQTFEDCAMCHVWRTSIDTLANAIPMQEPSEGSIVAYGRTVATYAHCTSHGDDKIKMTIGWWVVVQDGESDSSMRWDEVLKDAQRLGKKITVIREGWGE